MSDTKKRRDVENYEEYWKFTAAWTDIMAPKFNGCLTIIISFIDKFIDEINSFNDKKEFSDSGIYTKLQSEIKKYLAIDDISIRKSINEFVKLGFINPFLKGYHNESKKFIKETNPDKKRIIFSKIFYDNASLNSGVTEDNRELKHMRFFLTTLDKNKILNSNDIIGLMNTNIVQFPKGYLTKEELEQQYKLAKIIGFDDRKYNQIAHLTSILQNFVDLKYDKNAKTFYFADDKEYVEIEVESLKRDGVRHRIYKNELFELSREIYGKEVCFLEKKHYKVLIASHIKPWKHCILSNDEENAYNPDNGLLLSQTVDSYFDKFDVTFNDDGKAILGKKISNDVKNLFVSNSIDKIILNKQRIKFLEYHRKQFYEKNGV